MVIEAARCPMRGGRILEWAMRTRLVHPRKTTGAQAPERHLDRVQAPQNHIPFPKFATGWFDRKNLHPQIAERRCGWRQWPRQRLTAIRLAILSF
jgi:hypothetical protein